MNIEAITCCVGKMYAGQLARSLPIWLDTLDSLTIVTKPGDQDVLGFAGPSNLTIVETDVFTRYGAYFNKGAALCYAYAEADPRDWALHFDSDIIPPENWRKVAEVRAESDCLSGAFRYSEGGVRLDEPPLYPYGYFHLWHISNPVTWQWPLFEPWFPHAGSYDANFTDLFPKNKRRDLGFRLIHQGERRKNWFGPEANGQLMKQLQRVGYRRVRMMANRTGFGRLKVPKPSRRFCLVSDNERWVQGALRACRASGPFLAYARTKAWSAGWTLLDPKTKVAEIKKMISATQ